MRSAIDPALTIEKLQTMAESQHFDRKSARLAERELARHISAMANASGGVIALGIEDDGTISGVDDLRENAFRKVPHDLLQTAPAIQMESLQVDSASKILLVHISPSTNDVIKRTNGDAIFARW